MDKEKTRSIPSFHKKPPSALDFPAVKTSKQDLPFSMLSWGNFEKLCLRLARKDACVETCRCYGEKGQKQEGIDLYAQTKFSDKYIVYQCKRVENFGPSLIEEAVSKFLAGEWVANT